MSFSIFSLWATAGLAALAASIPIVIHLLHRQRTQPIMWGAMQFLIESPLQQKKRKKVEHWLLMLLRILVVVLLVAFVAWPRADRGLGLLGGGGGTDVAVVIDRSLSTGRRAGDTTVFQKSVDDLGRLISSGSLRATDTVSVVLAEHSPRKVTALPVPSGGMSPVMAELKKMTPGTTDASIPDAVRAARELLSRGRNGRKVVVVLSDRQRTGWKVNDLTAWNAAVGQRVKGVEPDSRVYEMPVTPDAGTANVTVADLKVAPELIGTARPAVITASISNKSTHDAPAQNAKLFVTGKQAAQQQVPALAAGQSQTVRFEYTFSDPGSNWVEVRIDAADGLAEDNSAVASAYVWQSLPVLIVDGQLTNVGPDSSVSQATFRTFKGSRFLLNAMLADAANPDAPPLVKPTVVSVADARLNDPKNATLKLEDYAVVVVNDVPQLPSAFQGRLEDYARAGHGVWVILGRNTERGFIKDGLAQARLMSLGLNDQQAAADKAPPLNVRDPDNGMLKLLAAPEHDAFTGMDTFRWWSVQPRDADDKVVVAASGSNDPLIIDRPTGSNGGRVVVWCTGADKVWNNWPATPSFAPLVNVTVYHLAGGATKGMENRQLKAGDPITWTGAGTPPVTRVTVTRPDGSRVQRRPVTRDGRQVLSDPDTYLPGRYELAFDQSSVPQPVYYGVGIDPSELDDAQLAPPDVQWLTGDEHKFVQATLDPAKGLTFALVGEAEDKNKIWVILALVVIAMLVSETFLTQRMIRRQSRPGAEIIPGASGAAPVPA